MAEVRHATEVLSTEVRADGNIDAVVYRIKNTGFPSIACVDRYKHTIVHDLQRVPVGCDIIMKDDFVNVMVMEKDTNKIIIKFDTAQADVNIRIW